MRVFAWRVSGIAVAAIAVACGDGPLDGGRAVIEPAPLESLRLSVETTLVIEGQSVALTAQVLDAAGTDRPDVDVSWRSGDPQIATVTPSGVVTALRLGTTPVIAEAAELVDTAWIEVRILFTDVSAGVLHSCGVSLTRQGYCWGAGEYGRLGTGNMVSSAVPVSVLGELEFESIAAGHRFTCGLTVGAPKARCWGANTSGQLGIGRKGGTLEPAPVAGVGGFVELTVHWIHACGQAGERSAYCWGDDWRGQLGNGAASGRNVPLAVAGDLAFASLDAGKLFTCGVTDLGRTFCWGDNQYGQLGRDDVPNACRSEAGDPIPCCDVPVAVSGAPRFVAVTAGGRHACGLTSEGVAFCWGANDRGQLGDGSVTSRSEPQRVTTSVTFRSLSAGEYHTCGIGEEGSAYCWGDNRMGAVGTSATFGNCAGRLCATTPVPVEGDLEFRSVSASGAPGGSHTCAVTREHLAYCWGQNAAGQLGSGAPGGNSFVPVRVVGQW